VANRIRFAGNTTNAIEEGDTPSIYRALIGELAGDGLAYLSIASPEALVANPTLPWPGPLPADDGRARPGVHRQPDLVGRYRTGAPLNPLRGNDFMDRGGAPGYTDCPALDTVGA